MSNLEEMRRAVSSLVVEALMSHTTELAQGVRISGSRDEASTFDYIESVVTSLGFHVARFSADALIGYPTESRVEVVSPGREEIHATGYALTPSTGSEGVQGQLVDVGAGGEEDYELAEVEGRVVLSTGFASSIKAIAADRAAPIAHINIDDDYLHEMAMSPVWGAPTPATLALIPRTPSVGIRARDGDRLRTLLRRGPVEVRVVSEMYRGWRKIPLLIADLSGVDEETFILFSGHVDSWHYGAMDNASANAVQLVIAKMLADQRTSLRRGVRLAFWSGHSHGRYAGSAWYADEYWRELYDRCICHVNIDSVGAVGASLLAEAPTMAETYDFAAEVLRAFTNHDLEYNRISRAGDQSFWGIGIPSIFMLLSEHVAGTADSVAPITGVSPSRRGANPWWWHTPEDTLDKIDASNLLRDARVYAGIMWGLCTEPMLPFDYSATVREIASELRRYDEVIDGAIDLSSVMSEMDELAAALAGWKSTAAVDRAAEWNDVMKCLGRALIPVSYTRWGPFAQDLAVTVPPLPGIADATRLARLQSGSDDWHALRVQSIRERNRLSAAVRRALTVIADATEPGSIAEGQIENAQS